MSSLHIKKINPAHFREALARYPTIAPEKLRDLDAQRYDVIPAVLSSRDPSNKHLTKAEVEKLVEWKLFKHGTFRPALLGLVQSNTSQAVEETTRKAYTALLDGDFSKPNIINALKVLVGLKGIGPATSSLLLSVLRPEEVPFFSDELFRWCCWDHEVKGKEGAGWERKIKYNFKEYEVMLDEVEKLRLRFKGSGQERDTSVRAADIEKVAWVLGKEGRVMSGGEEDEKHGDHDTEALIKQQEAKEMKLQKAESDDGKATQLPAKKGTKRKAVPIKTPVEGTRKSTRTKK